MSMPPRATWVKVNSIAVDAVLTCSGSQRPTRLVKWLGTNYASLPALRSAAPELELASLSASPEPLVTISGDFRPRADSR